MAFHEKVMSSQYTCQEETESIPRTQSRGQSPSCPSLHVGAWCSLNMFLWSGGGESYSTTEQKQLDTMCNGLRLAEDHLQDISYMYVPGPQEGLIRAYTIQNSIECTLLVGGTQIPGYTSVGIGRYTIYRRRMHHSHSRINVKCLWITQ